MSELNECQRTILEQLKATEPFFMAVYNVKMVLLTDATTIRLCCRTRHHINFDIHYDEGLDLYRVTAYLLRDHGLDVYELLNVQEVQWDQLAELLREAHEKAKTAPPVKPRSKNGLPSFEGIPEAVRRYREQKGLPPLNRGKTPPKPIRKSPQDSAPNPLHDEKTINPPADDEELEP